MKKEICIVAAMAKNRVIGMNNAMPCRGRDGCVPTWRASKN